MPEQFYEQTIIHGRYIIIGYLSPDEFVEKPDWDGFGQFHSRMNRHINYNKYFTQLFDEPFEQTFIIPLDYYEHGLCRWMPAHWRNQQMPDARWDLSTMAGAWEPDEYQLQEILKKEDLSDRINTALDYCRQDCETYTAWCNGDTWYYVVHVHPMKLDENGDYIEDPGYYDEFEAIYEDSCSGYYGSEHAEDELKYAIEWMKDLCDKDEARFEEYHQKHALIYQD